MIGAGGIGAHQQRHQIGAGGVGDPGLGAGDDVVAALFRRARLQSGEIGTGVGLGENGGGEDFRGSDFREPISFLRRRSAAEDELGGDFAARAERADADIAARKLFADDAHGGLAKARAAEFFRDGEAEDAELTHLPNDFERNEFVAHMPFVRDAGRPSHR